MVCENQANGGVCVDVNECATVAGAAPVCGQAFCVNEEGGYTCGCEQGQILSNNANGITCEPIPTTTAPPTITPTTPWTDPCVSMNCTDGFACQLVSNTEGTCLDIDECVHSDNTCRTYETCVNTEGSYKCDFNPAECAAAVPVVWKGAKYGRIRNWGSNVAEVRVAITNNDANLDSRGSNYIAYLAYGSKKCGRDFLRSLNDGRVNVDVADKESVYSIDNIFERVDGGNSITQISINANVAGVDDYPWTKKGENTKKDWIYIFFSGLDNVIWGNKDMEQCLKEVTAGAMQTNFTNDSYFDNACAAWQKTIW
jgi:hypothetical protein